MHDEDQKRTSGVPRVYANLVNQQAVMMRVRTKDGFDKRVKEERAVIANIPLRRNEQFPHPIVGIFSSRAEVQSSAITAIYI